MRVSGPLADQHCTAVVAQGSRQYLARTCCVLVDQERDRRARQSSAASRRLAPQAAAVETVHDSQVTCRCQAVF